MKNNIEYLRRRLREVLLSGDDTTALRADIAQLENEQRLAEAQVVRGAADRAAAADEAVMREARARAEVSANRLNNLITRLQPES